MKWPFSVKSKIKASLTLLILCAVVLLSNYRLRNLSNEVAESVESIYADRLVVQDLIFSYTNIVDKMEEGTFNYKSISAENRIENLNRKYLDTKLTNEEGILFNSFASKLNASLTPEANLNSHERFRGMRKELSQLREIQMKEAKVEMGKIDEIRKSQELGFYLETAVLVLLLLIVQILVVSGAGFRKIASEARVNLN